MSDKDSGINHGGNSAKITRDYFDSLLVEMRMMDAVNATTQMTLFGESFSTPVMTAALSGLEKVRPNGMAETAKGALAAGAVMWSGISTEAEMEAMTATGARTVKIIKPYADKDLIFKKLEHAEKCGALAVGMDIDYVFGGRQNKGFAYEFPVSPKTLDDIKSFVKATKLPFILKGVLSGQDAGKALEAGVGGILVSHHLGMIDYAVPPLKILPRIMKVVDKKIPVFVDCGISKGMDVFKALALGATAVCVGRPLMEGLKSDGALGVQKILEGITEELQWVMSHTGSPDIAHIDPEVIWE